MRARSDPIQYDDLTQASSSTAEAASLPTTAAPMVEVIAPANLPEGSTFEAQLGDQIITITVPRGGVSEGQKFSVPLPSVHVVDGSDSDLPVYRVPTEKWKDGLCDCCKHGCCHPMLWNAICCPAIAIAQVMTRMKLTWLGNPANPIQARQTFKRVASMVVLFVFLELILRFITISQLAKHAFEGEDFEDDTFNYEKQPEQQIDYGPVYKSARTCRILLEIAYFLYIVVVMTKTRLSIRETYEIEDEYFDRYEDFCCVVWCTCCTMTQMARHTADYDTYKGVCCSDTGLPPRVPPIV